MVDLFSAVICGVCRSSRSDHAVHLGVDHPAAPDVVIPALERLAKEGEAGAEDHQYTRYGTIALSLCSRWDRVRSKHASPTASRSCDARLGIPVLTMITLTAGTA